MFYLIIFLVIVLLATIGIYTKRDNVVFFTLLLLLLVITSIFRYGSGTDYFAYHYHFLTVLNELGNVFSYNNGFEIGFNLLIYVFNKLNFSYEIFVGTISLSVIFIFYKVISKIRCLE